MKIITTVQPVNVYVCETCDQGFTNEHSAVQCETDHKRLVCEHKNLAYNIDSEDDYGNYKTYISTSCRDCRKNVISSYQICDYLLSQSTLERIFELIKEG